jgi:polysaccharide biosynthesis protein PslJ
MEHVARTRAVDALPVALIGVALTLAAVAAASGSMLLLVPALALLGVTPIAAAREIPWRVALIALVLVITFIPIRRYTFAVGLPFQLEPYRALVALLLFAWAACLLVDPSIRLRRTAFRGPILLIAVVALASVLANGTRVTPMETQVIKSFTFFASFLLLYVLVANLVRTAADRDAIIRVLVGGMAVVGVLAVIEARTGWSPFNSLDRYFPLLRAEGGDLARGSGVRATGPAEHPIALSAVLVMTMPLAIYLYSTTKKRHWIVTLGALGIGALVAISRTGVTMLLAVALVYLWLRRPETTRLWPLLVPALALVHFAAPGTLGSLKVSFAPQGGLVSSQNAPAGKYNCQSSGRVADIGPAVDQVSHSPLVGIGFGTRVVDGPHPNACILDDQWLGTFLETGVAGLFAWLWLFGRAVSRLGRASRARSPNGNLCVAFAASIVAYAVGMATYDALGFVQVTFVFFLLLGLAARLIERDAVMRPV